MTDRNNFTNQQWDKIGGIVIVGNELSSFGTATSLKEKLNSNLLYFT